jgi:hypothetical protein
MMRLLCAVVASFAIGILPVVHGSVAAAANLRKPVQLTDAQLDKIAAGALMTAAGSARATGQSSRTEIAVTSVVRPGAGIDASTVGQVTARSTSNAGAPASATSTLSLSFAHR